MITKFSKYKVAGIGPRQLKVVADELLLDNKGKVEWSKTKSDYVRKGYVYYIKLSWDDCSLYKIGYTSRRDINKRMAEIVSGIGCRVELIELIEYKHLARAIVVEKLLHDRYKKYRFNGGNVIGNGWTELYVVDIRDKVVDS